MEFSRFVTEFLNRRDDNGMYWTLERISQETGTHGDVLQRYLNFCQQANLRSVQTTGRALPNGTMILVWDMVEFLSGRG